MKKIIFILLLLPALNAFASGVDVRGNWIYVDGEKYFVKAIGYAGYRQGEVPAPYAHGRNRELLEEDIKLIREAGFNTIRTWDARSKEELDLYAKYGLMVMFGFWFDQDKLLGGEEELADIINQIKEETERVKDCPNILMYLVIANEPKLTLVRDKDRHQLLESYRKIRDAVKSVDPSRPLALTYWNPIIFLDNSLWDVLCVNTYYHSPVTNNFSMGYRCYNEYLAKFVSNGKPFINTEFGIILGPKIYGGAKYLKYTYGGNDEQAQAEGVIELYDDLISSGAHGVSVLHFLDQWWVVGNPEIQDKHPEEWLGIAALTPESEGCRAETRPAYYALKEYNQALLISPRDMDIAGKIIPVEVFVTENISRVKAECCGRVSELKKTGKYWFSGSFDTSGMRDEVVTVNVTAYGEKEYHRKAVVWIKKSGLPEIPLKISIHTDKKTVKPGNKITLTVKVADELDKPVADKDVNISLFYPLNWMERIWTKKTDKKGTVTIEIDTPTQKGWINLAAGTEFSKNCFKKRVGDITTVFME
ncbi:MAG: glycoside hydrolase family 2 TIM barrel-domain containing protein [bacterium]|nr:glycoside hydrolase family 2 TIM barrel-domain containing protein [bacterium]